MTISDRKKFVSSDFVDDDDEDDDKVYRHGKHKL